MGSGRLRFTTSIPEAVGDAAVVFICVGRPPAGQGDRSLTAVEDVVRELARLDLPRLGAVMAQRAIVDGRNALDADSVVAAGFYYLSVGREPREPSSSVQR